MLYKMEANIFENHSFMSEALERVSSVFSFCTTLVVLIFALYYIMSKTQVIGNGKGKKRLPLPPFLVKPWPLVGSLPQMTKNKPTFRWLYKLMEEADTGIACIRFGNVHVIPVNCPEIARQFLKKHDAMFASRPVSMSTDITTKGFLTTALVPWGDQWKKMKKIMMNELLCPTRHRCFHGKRVEEADNLVRYVYNQWKDGELVNVRVTAQQYAGNLPRRMIFNQRYFGKGKEDGGPGIEEKEHVYALFTILAYLYSFCVSDYVPCLRGFDLDGHEKVMEEVVGVVTKYHDPLIEDRIQLWEKGGKMDVEDLLDVLITLKDEHGKPLLTMDEIKAQIVEFMIATVDNPSNAIEWALAEMLNQPEILEKATKEIDDVVGKERMVQESDFPQLNYVKACARESFRLHPLAPFNIPHVSMMDTTVANHFIPKGSHVLLNRKALGRNPKAWPDDTHKFKPERHLDGTTLALTEPDLRFISFSTGLRGCKGVLLGTTMTLTLFARLLHCFSWSIRPDQQRPIPLNEAEDSLMLAEPLVAVAKPRLASHVYPFRT